MENRTIGLVGLLCFCLFGCESEPPPGADAGVDAGASDARPPASEAGGADMRPSGCVDDRECDDGVGCTVDRCSEGSCFREPDHARCASGEVCDAVGGCVASRACASSEDCADDEPCTVNERCDPGSRLCLWDPLDLDFDGEPPRSCGGTDCDDSRPGAFPGFGERCDGIDDDCDGMADNEPAASASCGPGLACRDAACVCSGSSGGPITGLALGWSYTCALSESGGVTCWGTDTLGELGRGIRGPSGPAVVPDLCGVQQIAGGDEHVCVQLADGRVLCWGANDHGQIGLGGPLRERGSAIAIESRPREVSGLPPIRQIFPSPPWGTCAVAEDGRLWCWGNNETTPVEIPVADVVGSTTGCLLHSSGTVDCEVAPDEYTPVAGLADAATISGRGGGTCVTQRSGAAACWGSSNEYGQLGDGTTTPSATPRPVAGVVDAVAVSLGAAHGCVLLRDGGASCWGIGMLVGDGVSDHGVTCTAAGLSGDCSPTPVAVPGLSMASVLAAGPGHTCAGAAGGTVVCWGRNYDGQLGDGTTMTRLVPTAVVGL